MIIDQLNDSLSKLINNALKQGSKIRITSDDSIIIVEFEQDNLVTRIYRKGTLQKVYKHAASSSVELMHVFKELGYIVLSRIKSLAFWVGKKQDVYFIEILPKPSEPGKD